jgi:hypothetical protein
VDADFGNSVALSGDRAIVGSRFDSENGNRTGAAYVFEFDGRRWVERQKLTAKDGESRDLFGLSVAINGRLALIGARGRGKCTFSSSTAINGLNE